MNRRITLHKEHTYIQLQLWSGNVWGRGEDRIRIMAEKDAHTKGKFWTTAPK
jgi:hypothetical protein